VSVEFWPDASSASAEYGARPGHAQERREQLVGLLDLGDRGMTGAMEGGRGDDQDRRIDEQRRSSRTTVESMKRVP